MFSSEQQPLIRCCQSGITCQWRRFKDFWRGSVLKERECCNFKLCAATVRLFSNNFDDLVCRRIIAGAITKYTFLMTMWHAIAYGLSIFPKHNSVARSWPWWLTPSIKDDSLIHPLPQIGPKWNITAVVSYMSCSELFSRRFNQVSDLLFSQSVCSDCLAPAFANCNCAPVLSISKFSWTTGLEKFWVLSSIQAESSGNAWAFCRGFLKLLC